MVQAQVISPIQNPLDPFLSILPPDSYAKKKGTPPVAVVTPITLTPKEIATRVGAVLLKRTSGYPYTDPHGNFFVIQNSIGNPDPSTVVDRESFSGKPNDVAEKINDFATNVSTAYGNLPQEVSSSYTIHVVISVDKPGTEEVNQQYAGQLFRKISALRPGVFVDCQAKPLTRGELAQRVTDANWTYVKSALVQSMGFDAAALSNAKTKDEFIALLNPIIKKDEVLVQPHTPDEFITPHASEPVYFPQVWSHPAPVSKDKKFHTIYEIPADENQAIRTVYDDFRKARITTDMNIQFSDAGIEFHGRPEELKALVKSQPLVLHQGPKLIPLKITVDDQSRGIITLEAAGQTPQVFRNVTELFKYTHNEAFSIELASKKGGANLDIVTAFPVVTGFSTAHDVDQKPAICLFNPHHEIAQAEKTGREEIITFTPSRENGVLRPESVGTDAYFAIAIVMNAMYNCRVENANKEGFVARVQKDFLAYRKPNTRKPLFPGFSLSDKEKVFLMAIYEYSRQPNHTNLVDVCSTLGLTVQKGVYSPEALKPTLDLMALMEPRAREALVQALNLADKDHYKVCGPAKVIVETLASLGIMVGVSAVHAVVEEEDKRAQKAALLGQK